MRRKVVAGDFAFDADVGVGHFLHLEASLAGNHVGNGVFEELLKRRIHQCGTNGELPYRYCFIFIIVDSTAIEFVAYATSLGGNDKGYYGKYSLEHDGENEYIFFD